MNDILHDLLVKKGYKILILLAIYTTASACGEKNKKEDSGNQTAITGQTTNRLSSFDADSAYQYTFNQVNFGPRVPGTEAHRKCGDYLSSELKRLGATVVEQETELKLYNGKPVPARNIIGSFQPDNKNRILLCAHWDTRPFADHDPDPANYSTPIDGANDGAGSCGVLLEIARQIRQAQPVVGIDIIFFDAEDWGSPSFDTDIYAESGYCLGSKYWSNNPHVPGYTARYGILLDMVSAPDAVFYKELYSRRYASQVVQKIWEAAQALGHGKYFINADGGAIEDDHLPVNMNRKIPCIDIIHFDPNSQKGFGHYWHTLQDNMDQISKETMQAVGETVLYVLFNEK